MDTKHKKSTVNIRKYRIFDINKMRYIKNEPDLRLGRNGAVYRIDCGKLTPCFNLYAEFDTGYVDSYNKEIFENDILVDAYACKVYLVGGDNDLIRFFHKCRRSINFINYNGVFKYCKPTDVILLHKNDIEEYIRAKRIVMKYIGDEEINL